MPLLQNSLLRKLSLIGFSAFVLASCQTISTSPAPESSQIQQTTAEEIIIAQQLERDRNWSQAAAMYEFMAKKSAQPERSGYLQKTALMFYRDGDFDRVESFYNGLNENDLMQQDIVYQNVLLAGLFFEKGKTYQSLVNLPDLAEITRPFYKALALNVRSKGVLAIGKPLESAQLRIEISQFLESDQDISENQDFIWDSLNRISEPNIIKALSQHQTVALRGWLELNLIARRSNMLPAKIEPWIGKWLEVYPQHEAGELFASALLEESRLIYINPTRIALMLPFSNQLKNVSEAIQSGFLYAYYNDPRHTDIQLHMVDVSDTKPDELYLTYYQTVQEGADFIVGPLSKDKVNELQRRDDLDVPTLTLNYADAKDEGVNNLYQFGLRPEDEAEQIADYALTQKLFHAVTLLPDTDLGNRLEQSFIKHYEKLGGRVVGSERYPASKNDYSVAIKQLLHINGSVRRHSILDQVTGQKSEFIPRRRQDVDMVFIAGNPRQARLIKPQLKFHHAIDLPVYATSSISSGTSQPDADRNLDNTIFVDTPWALDNENNIDFKNIQKLWPSTSQRYAKFFALGMDAYKVIPSLRRMLVNPEERLALNSGTINVDSNGRIHRKLLLATYLRGRAKLLQDDKPAE